MSTPTIDFTAAKAIAANLKDGEELELQRFAMTRAPDTQDDYQCAQRGDPIAFYDLVLRHLTEELDVLDESVLEFDNLSEDESNVIVTLIETELDIFVDDVGG